jgi:hypothetical protein
MKTLSGPVIYSGIIFFNVREVSGRINSWKSGITGLNNKREFLKNTFNAA